MFSVTAGAKLLLVATPSDHMPHMVSSAVNIDVIATETSMWVRGLRRRCEVSTERKSSMAWLPTRTTKKIQNHGHGEKISNAFRVADDQVAVLSANSIKPGVSRAMRIVA